MGERVIEVELPNGAVALVRAAEIEAAGAEKVAWPDRFSFGDVAATLEGVAQAIRDAVERVKPDKMSVELGIELVVKSGKLTGLIVEGEGTGTAKTVSERDVDACRDQPPDRVRLGVLRVSIRTDAPVDPESKGGSDATWASKADVVTPEAACGRHTGTAPARGALRTSHGALQRPPPCLHPSAAGRDVGRGAS